MLLPDTPTPVADAPPDETLTPVTAATYVLCGWCGTHRAHRRKLCATCYKKALACADEGVTLPPRLPLGPTPPDPWVAFVLRGSPDMKRLVLDALRREMEV